MPPTNSSLPGIFYATLLAATFHISLCHAWHKLHPVWPIWCTSWWLQQFTLITCMMQTLPFTPSLVVLRHLCAMWAQTPPLIDPLVHTLFAPCLLKTPPLTAPLVHPLWAKLFHFCAMPGSKSHLFCIFSAPLVCTMQNTNSSLLPLGIVNAPLKATKFLWITIVSKAV